MGQCIENPSIDKVKFAVYREYRFQNAKEWTSHQRLDYQNQHAALNKMIDNNATMNNDVSQMLDDAYMTSFVLKPAVSDMITYIDKVHETLYSQVPSMSSSQSTQDNIGQPYNLKTVNEIHELVKRIQQ
ncbi:hypothetical protein HDU77_010671, partial [Chytriomyces hyalinus]